MSFWTGPFRGFSNLRQRCCHRYGVSAGGSPKEDCSAGSVKAGTMMKTGIVRNIPKASS